jgi:hypothetical protein
MKKKKKKANRVVTGELIAHRRSDGLVIMYTLIIDASEHLVVFLDDEYPGAIQSFESHYDADDMTWWK